MNVNQEPRNSSFNKTPTNIEIEKLDKKIQLFVTQQIIPEITQGQEIDSRGMKKLQDILCTAVELDVYMKKRTEMLKMFAGEKNSGNFEIFPVSMMKKLDKALSVVQPEDTIVGVIKHVNTDSKYAKKLKAIHPKRGVAALVEKSVMRTLEKMATYEDINNLLKGTSHIKTVIKLREYISQGGNINDLDTSSKSYQDFLNGVNRIKGEIARDNRYLTFENNEDNQRQYVRSYENSKKYVSEKDFLYLSRDYQDACKAGEVFISSQLIRLYQQRFHEVLSENVGQPIQENIRRFQETREYKRLIELSLSTYAPRYIPKLNNSNLSEAEKKEAFVALTKQALEEQVNRTDIEDYTEGLYQVFQDFMQKQDNMRKERAAEKRRIDKMSIKDIEEKINNLDLGVAMPAIVCTLGGALISAGAFSLFSGQDTINMLKYAATSIGTGAASSIILKCAMQYKRNNLERIRAYLKEKERQEIKEGQRIQKVQPQKPYQPVKNVTSQSMESNSQIEKQNFSNEAERNAPSRRRRRTQQVKNYDSSEIE